VQPEDSFVIIATDGVWDVMSSIEAVSFVHRRLLFHHDIQRVSRELTLKAIELASGDNCSCTIIGLNQVERVSGGRSCDATAPPPPPPPFNDSACFGEMGGINTHSD
jgi:serine/threonine protein phosphatase PrpC